MNTIETISTESSDMVVHDLQMKMPPGSNIFKEELLAGEIDDLAIKHFAFRGPMKQTIHLSNDSVHLFIIVLGKGLLWSDGVQLQLIPESIAIPMDGNQFIEFDVPGGEILHFLQLTKKLSTQDIYDLKNFPAENTDKLFFTRFKDCPPYTEKIKSPTTVSRTVLPADIVPRVSLGTVEALGPDSVGAHKHPMLEQLFLGLSDNDIIVHADNEYIPFKQFSLLHIPLGSNHWVCVEENHKMNYMWMDFFLSKEGQEWLNTHIPVNT